VIGRSSDFLLLIEMFLVKLFLEKVSDSFLEMTWLLWGMISE